MAHGASRGCEYKIDRGKAPVGATEISHVQTAGSLSFAPTGACCTKCFDPMATATGHTMTRLRRCAAGEKSGLEVAPPIVNTTGTALPVGTFGGLPHSPGRVRRCQKADKSKPRRHGESRSKEEKGAEVGNGCLSRILTLLASVFYRTATVTVLLGTPLWTKTSGTSEPGVTLAGISTFT